jgi:hypothetical protein
MASLVDSDLPLFFGSADRASLSAQKASLWSSRIRLLGTVIAAVGASFSLTILAVDVWAAVALLGFLAALIAEIFITLVRPDRSWYQARAAAESVKTLSWRYAVGADPFFPELPHAAAQTLFRERLSQVARQVAEAVPMPTGDGSAPTSAMEQLRASPLAVRKAVYLRDRTEAQRDWYTRKALANRKAAAYWRTLLLAAEVIATVLAAGRLFGGWTIDVAGILAAAIGAGAAWLALKQHTTLRAAYALTAAELEKQIGVLHAASEQQWPESVADAEEAISREHTMWLASRGEVNDKLR